MSKVKTSRRRSEGRRELRVRAYRRRIARELGELLDDAIEEARLDEVVTMGSDDEVEFDQAAGEVRDILAAIGRFGDTAMLAVAVLRKGGVR